MIKKQKFLIYRKNSDDNTPHYVRYEVPIKKGMSVLDALFYIQDHFDLGLAFRYSCRGAICGSCGLTVDKVPQLACKTQVASVKTARKPLRLPKLIFGDVPYWDEENEILIEPLPNMAVIKDLIVDMRPFWKFYQEVKPYFTREWKDLAPESLQAPKDARSIENLVYCILCGVCWTCPVNAENPHYLGPAALAKAYRFIADTRFNEDQRSLVVTRVSDVDAVPACEKHFVCNRVCPKNVKPGTAIKDIRDQYLIQ
ncbi:MAG: succinate dehydrogenase/fumarate reductase iron-sulfur subunit [Candidatus Heimdallarchaeota archaeon]|nr:MAG: succinate dehydrogenase/fumarate reductase iron-sulfur subunit [Candidatus Heimdallarchaeota archaeon]